MVGYLTIAVTLLIEGHEERTGITPTMEAAILDYYNCDYYCDCDYFKEYHDFWPTVLSVEPMVQYVVCLSVCPSVCL